jgi:ABC-type antimicrobial peptide transport system permease subunit
MDASIPVTLETAEDRIRESLVPQRVLAILSSTLGSIALLLASVGLYGLMAYRVSRRSNEIALRMAVGASNRDILTLVLRESLVVAGFGVVLGLGASIALGRMLKAALYGITSTDSVALLLSVLIMTMMALLAGYLPALRASRVDPAAALRQQ